jgi:DNA processing protein
MNYDQLKYWVALKSIPGIGNVLFQLLIDGFGSIENIFSASAHELQKIPGLSKKSASAIVSYKDWDKMKNDLESSSKAGIKIITCHDDLYPAKLLNIYDRPPFLYYKGSLNKGDINIAIVGSRLASTYGKYTTGKISRELALKGITIVSGLARGIDSAAHRGALAAQGRTIAILGSGLDVIYPPENKNLYADIIQNGAVISEFPLATEPHSGNFPARNRIISGMSYGVVVVEAGEKSGSLITARLAMEQGREVFAVPGSIDSAGSRGTNKLIKQGAKLIENIDDILEEIWPQIERAVSSTGADSDYQERPKNKKDITNEILTSIEQNIVDSISGKNIHVDDLISVTGLSTGDLMSSLMSLELKGIIAQHPGKFFSLKKSPV